MYRYYVVAEQESNTVKLPLIFQRLQNKERVLKADKSMSTVENAFNGNYF